jgi:hypothetical protein
MHLDRDAFMAEFGAAIDNLVARYRSGLAESSGLQGKTRWIDGTPEYSLHICGLRKLFPAAKFVHIVRDVDAVVASMLNFHRLNGERLVTGPAHAYAYWKATVDACVDAEWALGSEAVHRVRYPDLIQQPESTLAGIFAFLGESYEAACREPLLTRINSSDVPTDFVIDTSQVAPELLQAAHELSQLLQEPCRTGEGFASAAARFSETFEKRVKFIAGLDGEYAEAQQEVARVQSELATSTRWALHLEHVLDKFGALLIAQCLLLAGVALAAAAGLLAAYSLAMPICLASSATGALAFAWMRRARLLLAVHSFWVRLRVSPFPLRIAGHAVTIAAGRAVLSGEIDDDHVVRTGEMQHLPESAELARQTQGRT